MILSKTISKKGNFAELALMIVKKLPKNELKNIVPILEQFKKDGMYTISDFKKNRVFHFVYCDIFDYYYFSYFSQRFSKLRNEKATILYTVQFFKK